MGYFITLLSNCFFFLHSYHVKESQVGLNNPEILHIDDGQSLIHAIENIFIECF